MDAIATEPKITELRAIHKQLMSDEPTVENRKKLHALSIQMARYIKAEEVADAVNPENR
jgi:hypothetical protein